MEKVRDHPCRLATGVDQNISNGRHSVKARHRSKKKGGSQCNTVQMTVSMPVMTPNGGRQGLCAAASVMSGGHGVFRSYVRLKYVFLKRKRQVKWRKDKI